MSNKSEHGKSRIRVSMGKFTFWGVGFSAFGGGVFRWFSTTIPAKGKRGEGDPMNSNGIFSLFLRQPSPLSFTAFDIKGRKRKRVGGRRMSTQ